MIFLWYTRRTPYLCCPLHSFSSVAATLFWSDGANETTKEGHPARALDWSMPLHSQWSAARAFIFSCLFGLGSAKEFHEVL